MNRTYPNNKSIKQDIGMKSFITFFSSFSFEKKLLLTITPIITVLLTSQQAILGLFTLILIDLITGAYKSLHIKNVTKNPFKRLFWKTITSKGMRETWKKAYEYGIGIIVLALLEGMILRGVTFNIFESDWSFTQIGIALACVIEAYSIFENIEAVTGNNPLKKLTTILTGIRKIFKN